jgi:hypothetical protein
MKCDPHGQADGAHASVSEHQNGYADLEADY